MRDLPPLEGDVEEIDGRGLCAIPGLVDCHTHPAFAGDRANEFALRAGGATYEELLAAGGGILSTTRATRAAGAAELREIVARHRDAMLAHGTTTFEGKSGYGLDRDTELAQLEAVARGRRRADLARRARRSARAARTPTRTSTGRSREVLPEAARIAVAADVFVERGTFDVEQARRYLRRVSRRPGSSSASTATSSPRWARSRSRSSSARARSTTWRRPAPDGRRARSRRATSPPSCFPSPRSTSARPMPPGTRAGRRGRRDRPRDRLQPGQRVLREPARSSARSRAPSSASRRRRRSPRAPSTPRTCSASHDRGRIAAGLRADLVLLDAPDWRHLAYHLAGERRPHGRPARAGSRASRA